LPLPATLAPRRSAVSAAPGGAAARHTSAGMAGANALVAVVQAWVRRSR
jgi:hypothetical protein